LSIPVTRGKRRSLFELDRNFFDMENCGPSKSLRRFQTSPQTSKTTSRPILKIVIPPKTSPAPPSPEDTPYYYGINLSYLSMENVPDPDIGPSPKRSQRFEPGVMAGLGKRTTHVSKLLPQLGVMPTSNATQFSHPEAIAQPHCEG
jgi:hypothetical protein